MKGYKTYTIVALGALVWVLTQLGYITTGAEISLFQLLGIGAVGAIRHAMK